MVADGWDPNQKISMFKLCSEEYFQTKPVLNFAWSSSTHAEALGLKTSFSVSLMRTRALLKWIYKLERLHCRYLRTFRETCLFHVILHRLSQAIRCSAQRSKEQINPAPFPISLTWGFALPCSPGRNTSPRHIYLLHIMLCIHYYIYLSSHITLGAFIKGDVYANLYLLCFLYL